MGIASTKAPVFVAPPKSLDTPHVHTWELRAVEFDTWGQVSLYECLDCPQVRYI